MSLAATFLAMATRPQMLHHHKSQLRQQWHPPCSLQSSLHFQKTTRTQLRMARYERQAMRRLPEEAKRTKMRIRARPA